MSGDVDLSRFVEAHERDFARALAEIRAGRKTSHWMWFVFPQIAALGRSPTARHYAIGSVAERDAFLAHPVLGDNYRRIVEAVADQVVGRGVSISNLFGSPDDVKLVSSLTLFPSVAHAEEILEAAAAQGLPRCAATERFLARSSSE